MQCAGPRQPGRAGRVLGSFAVAARSLSPAPRSGRLSPSGSMLSLNSEYAESSSSGFVGSPGRNAQGNENGSLLVCPICSEETVTLLQLNRHLDDVHKEVEEIDNDDIKTWFKKRMQQAKSFQPVTMWSQKLKGLDVFESNETISSSLHSSSLVMNGSSIVAGGSAGIPKVIDPESLVTKAHFQKPSSDDDCLEPTCRKPLGVANGCVNCWKCGRLFCEEHTMYQIRLSRSAQHEPVRGFWCRVCETCYKSREGYNDHNGLVRDHTKEFANIRRKTVDRAYLEVTRLEKRLTKLTQLLTSPPSTDPGSSGFIKTIASIRNQRRILEQSVVAWEDDSKVVLCPLCKQTFSQFSVRKHHCRLCGRVVCGDPRTGCSNEIGLNVTADTLTEKPMNELSLDIRICRECKSIVFGKRDFAMDVSRMVPDVRTYQTLVQFEQGIKVMMPRFQKLLTALQDPYKTPTPAQLTEATRTRKKLLDTFAQYDAIAKRILNLPTESTSQKQLQKAIHQSAVNFLHLNMLPLKALPKLLHKRGQNGRSASSYIENGTSSGAVIRSASSDASSVADEKEKQLKEQIMVLEEQRFLVEEMMKDANKRRRFDEVAALGQSVEELEGEIGRLTELVEQL
ncbi:carboxypeptidase Y-deficient [Rhizina undulata]